MQASRTNNNNEAYNHRLDTRLNGKNHPNIWSFIEIIKTEESLMNVNYERVIAGTMKRRGRKTRDVERDLAIANAYGIYLESAITIDDLEYLLDDLALLTPNFS